MDVFDHDRPDRPAQNDSSFAFVRRWKKVWTVSLGGILAVLINLPLGRSQTTYTWNTTATTGNFATAANWAGSVAPLSSANSFLVFGASSTVTTLSDNQSGFTYGNITFSNTAPAFTIGGNAFTLSGQTTVIANNSAATETINNAITLSGATNQTIAATSGAITFGGAISVSNTVGYTFTGSNAITFNGTVANIAGANRTFTNNDTGGVTFAGNITLAPNNTPRTFIFNGNSTTTISGAITNGGNGAGNITYSGTGNLLLTSNSSTYNGTTTVSSGTVRATAAAALGTSVVSLGGGTLQLANDTATSFNNNVTLTASSAITSDVATNGNAGVTHTLGTLSLGAQTLSVTAGSNVGSGTAGLTFGTTTLSASGAIFDVGSNANLTLGALAGNFNFTKQNSGTLTLGTASTRSSGSSTLTGGTTLLGSASAFGTTGTTLSLGGGTLDLAINSSVNAYNTTVTASSTILSDKATANSAGITHTLGTLSIGSQTLSIADGANVSSNSAFGVTFGATTQTGNATFDVANNGTGVGTLTLGALAGGGSARTITKTNDGTLVFNANASSTTAGSSLIVNGGIAQVNTATALGSGNYSVTVNSNNATGTAAFNLNNVSQTIGSLTFGGSGATANAVNSVATGTGTLTLGGGVTYDATNNPGTATISGNLALGATRTFNIGASSNAATELSVSAIVSGSGFGITKSGAGTLALSGANTYTGKTSIQDGTISVASLNKVTGGTASSNLGAPTTVANGTIDLGSTTTTGTLKYTGAGETTDRVINLAGTTGGGTIDSSGSGALTFSSALTATGAGSKTLTLQGTNTNANTFSGAIVDNSGTNKTSVTKAGSGNWTLSGTNSYTGVTSVTGGTLLVGTLAAGLSNSSIGASSNAATNLVLNGGTLQYTGGSVATDRLFSIGTTAGTTLDAGAGGGTVTFNNTGNIGFNGQTGARTLTLAGTSNGSLAAVIGDNSGATSITKNGSGTWTLTSATSNYTGATTINSGTLSVGTLAAGGVVSSIGNSTNAAANLVLNGGTLQYTGGTVATDRLFSVGSSGGTIDAGTTGGGTVTFNNTGNIGFNSQTGTRTLTLTGSNNGSLASVLDDNSGASSLTKSGTGTWTLTGNNTYTGTTTVSGGNLTVSSGAAIGAATSSLVVNTGGTLNLNNAAQTVSTLTGTGGLINLGANHNLTVNGASTNSTWTGNLALPSGNATISTSTNLLVLGDGLGYTNTIALGGNTLTFNTVGTPAMPAPSYLPNPAIYAFDPTNVYVTSVISGTGGITKTGTGTVTLSSGGVANSFTGNLTITGGKVILAGPADVAAVSSGNIVIGTSGNTGAIDTVSLQNGQITTGYYGTANIIGVNNATITASSTNLTIYEDGVLNMNNGANGFANITLKGGHIDGGNATTSTLLTAVGGITTLSANQTATINHGDLNMNPNVAGNFTFNIGASAGTGTGGVDLIVSDVVQNGRTTTGGGLSGAAGAATNLVKTGLGTLELSGSNIYLGNTLVTQGILNVQKNLALGADGGAFGAIGNGTIVSSGAQLQLQAGAFGNITITNETLTLNSVGYNNSVSNDNTGGLLNVSGNNIYHGEILVAAPSRINSASDTLTIEAPSLTQTVIDGTSASQALTFGGAGNVVVSGSIASNIGTITKDGSGTLTLAGQNLFGGGLEVTSGYVKTTNNQGLYGTSNVTSGASLQLAGNITTAPGTTTLRGDGVGGNTTTFNGTSAALENLAGNNTFNGPIVLAASSSIKTTVATDTLTINTGGSVDLAGASHNALTIGGAGNVTFTNTATIRNGNATLVAGTTPTGNTSGNTYSVITSAPGTGGTLNKIDSGTLTIAGAGTSQVDNVTLNGGNLIINGSATLLSGPISVASGTTLTINSGSATAGGLVTFSDATLGPSTISGTLAGSGTLQFDASTATGGKLVFNHTVSPVNMTLLVTGGEIDLTGAGTTVTFGTIHIAGNTILDFGGSAGTTLSSSSLIIDAGISITVNNWVGETDFWLATTAFTSGGVGVTPNQQGVAPQNQITFTGFGSANTAWLSWAGGPYTNHEIRPIPEPATYGAIFFSGCLALLGYRRLRRRH